MRQLSLRNHCEGRLALRRILQSGTQKVEILRSHELDSDDTPMEFGDRLLTLDLLRGFMHDPLNMVTLRSALAELIPVTDIFRLTDEEVLQQFAWQISRRYFELVLRVEELPRLVGPGTSSDDSEADSETAAEEEAPATSAAPIATAVPEEEEETDWIEFRVVDDETDQPVSGIGLKIKLPAGETKDYTTDSNGIVHIDDLPPGTCDIVEITDPDASEVVQVE